MPSELPIVLIVDDVPTNIHILADALRHECRIKVAVHGEEALDIARTAPQPDLILLDVMMPDLDGYEVCRRLKNDPITRAIPIIFVSARDAEDDQTLGFNLGGVDYITKPFSIPVVRARVRTHIRLKRQTDALQHLSRIDPLTGVANRRHFDELIQIEMRRALRDQDPLSLLMIDIDYFKGYNDYYGHGAGDLCLQQVANTLANGLSRPGDLLARYGGEEFIAVLPATVRTAAHQLADRLRINVLQLGIAHAQSPAAAVVTISVGVATLISTPAVLQAHNQSEIDVLLKEADTLLYSAKASGRNCVMSVLPLDPAID
ncbi:diguanylate cyclase [Thiospirillum jenense]|uniref:diguanylate cyclase n=1 Tax=Thiospirillum jenense TaxID=1653858 RepID=A0A839HH77_9GAMM|nr:diguanylate cyclase [Thiospirillum jenense]MBB1126377.1 diguanylate cyclase [Thiospirillum jenense]